MMDAPRRWPAIALRLLWAAPCTLLGAALGSVVLLAGGSVRRVGRTIEFALHRGDLGSQSRGWRPPFSAITFGHVILGIDRAELARLRAHERVHVRQYEWLGPLFLLAYPAASLVAWLRGQCPYAGNVFERHACREAARAQPVTRSAG